jgi:cytochrome oxidase Cu insertion factor (SCO1/SenC/PrrC family)
MIMQSVDIALAVLLAVMLLLVILRLLRPAAVHVGAIAPDFTLEDTAGRKVTLSHLAGRWVVLAFYIHGTHPG